MRIREQGLIEGPMMYVILALVAALAFCMAGVYVLSGRLDACQETVKARDLAIKLQNDRVDQLKADSDERIRMAEAGRRAAAIASQPQAREATRLRTEATKAREPEQPVVAGSCHPSAADRGVAILRRGL